MCAAFPDATRLSGAAGSAAMARGSRIIGNLFAVFWLCLPYVIPVHLPLDVQRCGILWHPGVLGKGNFVKLCFTGCRLKGNNKGRITQP